MLVSDFLAISRRKLYIPIDEVIMAIHSLDLKKLSLENVELLQKMIPTEAEVKAYKEYIIEKKDQNLLSEEDRFMLQLSKVERISSKLAIMNYMGNFFDSIHLLSPVSIYNIYNILEFGSKMHISFLANSSNLSSIYFSKAIYKI